MILRKILLISSISLFFNLSYAGELVSRQRINYYNEGVRAQKTGDFNQAATAYQKALLLASEDPDYQKRISNNLGVIYAQQGDFAKAEAMFNEILGRDQNYKPVLYNLGLIYYMQEDKDTALEYWVKYFSIDLDNPNAKNFIIEQEQKPELK
jgi:tetratricopeptide (TPR) repeat protein